MSGFINPYNFVRVLTIEPRRRKPPGFARFEGLSGRIRCRLTMLTPLCTSRRGAKAPVLDATSIKGPLSLVAECMSPSCLRVISDELNYPPAMRACTDPDSLCPACGLFGMVSQEGAKRAEEVPARSGRVRIDNVTPAPALLPHILIDPLTLSFPRPKSEFYAVRGRKMYWHHLVATGGDWNLTEWEIYASRKPLPAGFAHASDNRVPHPGGGWRPPPRPPEQQQALALLPARSAWTFDVRFENLEPWELGLLASAIQLKVRRSHDGETTDERMPAHRVGGGKPLGFGSCSIDVEAVEVEADGSARFKALRPPVASGSEPDPLATYRIAYHDWLADGPPRIGDLASTETGQDLLTMLSTNQPRAATSLARFRESSLLSAMQDTSTVRICYPPGPCVSRGSALATQLKVHWSERSHLWPHWGQKLEDAPTAAASPQPST